MTEQIRDERLNALNTQAERAQAVYEEGKQSLFRPDGSKLYSDEVHEDELTKLAAERKTVVGGVEQEAREAADAARGEIERIESADLADALTEEELARANQKRAFALDAAETMGPEAFKKRLESVLAGGDRGNIFAYWMAGRRKAEGLLDQRRQGLANAGRSSATTGSITNLHEVLGKLEAALGGKSRDASIAAAQRREAEAERVEYLAGYLKDGYRGAASAYGGRKYGRVS
jgi:hypothetical protein